MGITIAPVVDGITTSASGMRTKLETIRVFTNRGVVAADLPATGTFQTRHFKHLESFGSPSTRTVGVSGAIVNRQSDGLPVNRAIYQYDATGDQWANVWAAHGAYTAPEEGDYEVTACVWAWMVKSERTDPETAYDSLWGEAAAVRIAVDANGQGQAVRRIWDSGKNLGPTAGGPPGAGYFRYPARQISLVGSGSMSAGRHQIGVQVFMHSSPTEKIGILYIGARVMSVEFYRR